MEMEKGIMTVGFYSSNDFLVPERGTMFNFFCFCHHKADLIRKFFLGDQSHGLGPLNTEKTLNKGLKTHFCRMGQHSISIIHCKLIL